MAQWYRVTIYAPKSEASVMVHSKNFATAQQEVQKMLKKGYTAGQGWPARWRTDTAKAVRGVRKPSLKAGPRGGTSHLRSRSKG